MKFFKKNYSLLDIFLKLFLHVEEYGQLMGTGWKIKLQAVVDFSALEYFINYKILMTDLFIPVTDDIAQFS